MKRKAAARPQAGRFRRVSRGGTSSVVDTKKIPPIRWHGKGERGPPAGGQFLPVSRGGTSSVVEIKKIPPFGWHRKEERV